jgi:lincosamide nucleotidyltransferase
MGKAERALPQHAMIERARAACLADQRVVAALMYGSFTRGEGDQHSDIEFALFFEDDTLAQVDQRAWVAQIAPVLAYFSDANRHHTAHFAGLVRGEFHFKPASAIAWVAEWRGNAWFPSVEAALLVDRTGELARALAPLVGPAPERDTPDEAQRLALYFIDGIIFGTAVLARGELARALELLAWNHRNLLQMVRIIEGTTEHWPTPSRGLERDISPAAYARYQACTAPCERAALAHAYCASWHWGRELIEPLYRRHGLTLPDVLLEALATRIDSLRSPS